MQTITSDQNHYILFYVRREHFRNLNFGDVVPTLAKINETHVMVGAAQATDLEHLFERMNLWEEDGLPRLFRKGVTHQSMSVGDIARLEVDGQYKYWVCRPLGWEEITE